MIDRTRERLIPIGRVAEQEQLWPDGKSPHPERSRRWARKGCRGVRLKTVLLGGRPLLVGQGRQPVSLAGFRRLRSTMHCIGIHPESRVEISDKNFDLKSPACPAPLLQWPAVSETHREMPTQYG